jgi:hypothetical protein
MWRRSSRVDNFYFSVGVNGTEPHHQIMDLYFDSSCSFIMPPWSESYFTQPLLPLHEEH